MAQYFSDSERGTPPRISEEISLSVWGALVAVVKSELNQNSFGLDFPSECPDGGAVDGNDWNNFSLVLRGEIPDIPWPLAPDPLPDKYATLDLVQFCFQHIAEPQQGYYHGFYRHHHLTFDRDAGKKRFRESVNRIFGRNGIAFDLQDSGDIVRLANPALQPILAAAVFKTGDSTLDTLLEDSRRNFLDPKPTVRHDALEKLWDAWERTKTIESGENKKETTKMILDAAASEPSFRELLEIDARELTRVGNKFRIRHSETDKVEIQEAAQVDYLFQRMFAMVMLLLSCRGSSVS